MSRKIALNYVYRRKRQRMNSVVISPVIQPTNDEVTVLNNSAIGAESLSLTGLEYVRIDATTSRNSHECEGTGSNKDVRQQQNLNVPLSERRILDDAPGLLNRSRNCSQLSTSSTLSPIIPFSFVYKRKRRRMDSNVFSPVNQEHAPYVSDCPIEATKSVIPIPFECTGGDKISIYGVFSRDEVIFEDGVLKNSSSSISNMEHSSIPLNDGVNDSGECSSSSALIIEKLQEMSEYDICISILRTRGLLDNTNEHVSTRSSSDKYCSKSCRVCNRRDSTKNMLICDKCEDAFHNSCCRSRIKILPVGEWHCFRCLTEKYTAKSVVESTGNCRNNTSACDAEIGSLGYTLRDTEPYMSNVRIGDKYQADTPEWNGPVNETSDFHGHPLELDPCSSIAVQEVNSSQSQLVKLGFISNWIQCQGILNGIGDGSDGVVCGKWRRAPVFEVQSDDWECFCCVSWDLAHADCAAPQEMETEEVVKQLKYIDMLRPRIMEKRSKMYSLKRDCDKNRELAGR